MTTDLCFRNAKELAAGIRRGDFSSVELTAAHIAQIERVNPAVNAVVTFLPEQALARAEAADDALARGEEVGPAARSADAAQGYDGHGGHPHDLRFADSPGQCAGPEPADHRAAACGRRDPDGQGRMCRSSGPVRSRSTRYSGRRATRTTRAGRAGVPAEAKRWRWRAA